MKVSKSRIKKEPWHRFLCRVHGPSQVAPEVKNLPATAGDVRDVGWTPGSGRSPGGGNGNSLQCSCLENPVDRGAWQATVHRVAKSQTRLSDFARVYVRRIHSSNTYILHSLWARPYSEQLNTFILIMTLQSGKVFHSHFTDAETETQRAQVSGLGVETVAQNIHLNSLFLYSIESLLCARFSVQGTHSPFPHGASRLLRNNREQTSKPTNKTYFLNVDNHCFDK